MKEKTVQYKTVRFKIAGGRARTLARVAASRR